MEQSRPKWEDPMSVKYLYLVAVAAIIGCATAGNTSGTSPASRRSASVLTASEIAYAHADVASAYDAVARLRPNWLTPHGITSGNNNGAGTEYALVFVDGQQFGDINSLRNIPAFHVTDIRYYDITQAGAKYGILAGSSGVIDVSTNIKSRS
jgi:hypothetical protein